jgi:phosphatidylglycerophosphate synthase
MISRDTHPAAQTLDWTVRMGPANQLSALRAVIALPVFFLILDGRLWAAVSLFAIGSLSDVADGIVARRRGETTDFGAVIDPLADIVSTSAVFGALFAIGLVPTWVVVLLAGRYGLLFAGSALLWRITGPFRFRATVVGKIVGVLQAVTATLIIVLAALEHPWGEVIAGPVSVLLGAMFTAVIVSQIVIGIRFLKRAHT